MLTYKRYLTQSEHQSHRTGVSSFVLLDEAIRTLHFLFINKKNSPYEKLLERKTAQCLEGGLVASWIDVTYTIGGEKRTAEEIGPQVLTMEHLEIGFIVWLVPLAFCLLVFAIEVGIRPCRRMLAYLRHAIVARSVVLTFIEYKHRSTKESIRTGRAWDAPKQRKIKLPPFRSTPSQISIPCPVSTSTN